MNTPLLQHITLIGKQSSVLSEERLELIEKCSINVSSLIEMHIRNNNLGRDDRSFVLFALYSLGGFFCYRCLIRYWTFNYYRWLSIWSKHVWLLW